MLSRNFWILMKKSLILSMSEVLQKTHLNVKVPNTQNVSEEQIARGQKLLGDVVDRVKKIMADKCAEYKEKLRYQSI